MSEYWIVDPEHETIKVHRLEGGKYVRTELTRARDEGLTTPLLPGLILPLRKVFALP